MVIKQDQPGIWVGHWGVGGVWRLSGKMEGCGFSTTDKMTEVHGKKVEMRKSSLCGGTLLFIAGMLHAV